MKEKYEPYMDLIDYYPGQWEKACRHLRLSVLRELGIPKDIKKEYPGTYISKNGYLIITKKRTK